MLKIYGSPNRRQELEPKLIWATPGQRGFSSANARASSSVAASSPLAGPSSAAGPSTQRRANPAQSAAQSAAQLEATRKRQEALQKAADLKKMLNSLEQVDDEARRSSLLDQLLSTDDILNLPVHPNPPGVGNGLVVDLLKHQVRSYTPSFTDVELEFLPSRAKPSSGRWSEKTQSCQRRRRTSPFNFGS